MAYAYFHACFGPAEKDCLLGVSLGWLVDIFGVLAAILAADYQPLEWLFYQSPSVNNPVILEHC